MRCCAIDNLKYSNSFNAINSTKKNVESISVF
jgi:hypothetical protein